MTTDEPTEPLGAVPGGLRVDQQPAPDGRADRARGRVGEHRRPDGPDQEPRRWPLVAILCVLAVLAVSGLVRLATSSLPQPSSAGQAVPGPTIEEQLSTPDGTTTTEDPLGSASAAATPTDTLSASASASPFPSSSPTRTPTPTRSSSPSPTTRALVAVPGVVGKRQSAATSTLRSAGFVVAVVRSITAERRLINRVVSQSPGAGTMARRGTTVTIAVGVAGPP